MYSNQWSKLDLHNLSISVNNRIGLNLIINSLDVTLFNEELPFKP